MLCFNKIFHQLAVHPEGRPQTDTNSMIINDERRLEQNFTNHREKANVLVRVVSNQGFYFIQQHWFNSRKYTLKLLCPHIDASIVVISRERGYSE